MHFHAVSQPFFFKKAARLHLPKPLYKQRMELYALTYCKTGVCSLTIGPGDQKVVSNCV